MKENGMTCRVFRSSNFELLRIVAMIMIVGYHLANHGVINMLSDKAYNIYSTGTTVNKWATSFWGIGGEVGVALFFIITGYFYVKKDKLSLLKIVLEVVFYGFLCTSLAIIIKLFGGNIGFDIFSLLKSLFLPVTAGVWWFVTAYVFLMFMTPLINLYARSINRKGFFALLIIFWLFEYSLANFCGTIYYELQKAIFFYLIGAFCRLHLRKIKKSNNKKWLLIFFFACWGMGTIVCFFFGQYSICCNNILRQKVILKLLSELKTAVIVPACAFLLFRYFESLNMRYNKLVNDIASTTFGVYLLHDSPALRNYIWNEILQVNKIWFFHRTFPIELIIMLLLVFSVCSAIDYGRIKLIEPFLIKKTKKIMTKLKLEWRN